MSTSTPSHAASARGRLEAHMHGAMARLRDKALDLVEIARAVSAELRLNLAEAREGLRARRALRSGRG